MPLKGRRFEYINSSPFFTSISYISNNNNCLFSVLKNASTVKHNYKTYRDYFGLPYNEMITTNIINKKLSKYFKLNIRVFSGTTGTMIAKAYTDPKFKKVDIMLHNFHYSRIVKKK